MAAIVNIPFNFQPIGSPSRKTTAYTVPAGKYAKAILSFYQPRYFSFSSGSSGATQNNTMGYITINGVNVLSERSFGITLNPLYAGSSNYTIFLNITGFSGLFQGTSANIYQLSTNGSFVYNVSTSLTGYVCFPFLNSISAQVPLSNFSMWISGSITSHSTPEFVEVWLKAGDVINATAGNWQAIVTEYNVPA